MEKGADLVGEGESWPVHWKKTDFFMDLRDVITAGYVTSLNPPAFQKKFLFNFFLHVFSNSTKSITEKELLL